MEVAINNLVGSDGESHSVILGEMLEVGSTSKEEHLSICQRLQSLNLKLYAWLGVSSPSSKKNLNLTSLIM